MQNDYCDITLVLDESGSMSPLQQATIESVNGFIREQRKQPGKCVLSIMKFNHQDIPVYTARPIASAEDLSPTTYSPNGNTALLDALGRSIQEAGNRFKAMPESERPAKVIVAVLTDGEENSSHQFKKSEIKEMIERQQTVYRWEFVFMGANIDSFAEAGDMAFYGSHTMNYQPTGMGLHSAMASMTLNTSNYRAGRKMKMDFTKEQSDAAAGTVDPPTGSHGAGTPNTQGATGPS